MPGIARLGDISTSDPCLAPPRINIEASTTVFANNKGVHRVGDAWLSHSCPGDRPHNATLLRGSNNVFANGKAVGRIGDPISCGSFVASGSSNVLVNG